jgi:GNAT superfamily N-acetyltransferase
MKKANFQIIPADQIHVDDICHVLITSINELCAPDYDQDPTVIKEWLSNKTPENVSAWISASNNHSHIAVADENIVAGFSLINTNGEILLIYVLPEYLNKGMGKALLDKMEFTAQNLGLTTITTKSTITAKPFYERNGFLEDGEPIYVKEILGEFPLKKNIS